MCEICLKLTIKTAEQSVKFVQSYQKAAEQCVKFVQS